MAKQTAHEKRVAKWLAWLRQYEADANKPVDQRGLLERLKAAGTPAPENWVQP